MSYLCERALSALNELHSSGRIEYNEYDAIFEGLAEVQTLRDRDDLLELMWAKFEDVPMNPETECIEEQFYGWGPGIHREEIWHWFDERYSKGVVALLYGSSASTGASWLTAFIRDEVPYRLTEVLGVDEEDMTQELVDECIKALDGDHDAIINSGYITEELEKILDQHGIQHE